MDLHEIVARFLEAAKSGASSSRIGEIEPTLRTDEVKWILDSLITNKLVEIGESSVYWTTVEGAKFLDIHFNMERMLKVQSSLV